MSQEAGAPRARVFATRGLRGRKAPETAEKLKKGPIQSKRRKKSYGHLEMGTRNRQCGKRGHGPDRSQKSRDFGPSPSGGLKGEPNFAGFLSLTVRADLDADWRI